MRQEMAEGRGEIVRQHLIPSTLGDGFLMHDSEGNLAPGAGRAMQPPWVMHDGQRHRLDASLAPGFLLIGRPGWSPGEAVWRQAEERPRTDGRRDGPACDSPRGYRCSPNH